MSTENAQAIGLEQRISRLEKSNRNWKLLTGAITLSAAAMCFIGAAGPVATVDEVRAHKFVVVDENDQTASEWSYQKQAFSGVMFYDPATKTRVSGFGTGNDGSGALLVATKDGRPVVIHSGAVNDKGIPLENIQKALNQIQHIQQ